MENTLRNRLTHAWNVFRNKDNKYLDRKYVFERQYKLPYTIDRTILASVISRIAVDASTCTFRHVRLDENGNFKEELNTYLNNALCLETNKDQNAIAFIQDLVVRMLSDGAVAVVVEESNVDPMHPFDINSMRCAKILTWSTDEIEVRMYNELEGMYEDVFVKKKNTAIVENPFYYIMNEDNSILKRLSEKLALLDISDNRATSNKLDLIIQLPYVIKSSQKKEQAEARRNEIIDQLQNSEYGIAYTDGTERITQLNRPVTNSLLESIKYLTDQLFAQLGITEEILNGTASELAMLNYYKRVVDPILHKISLEFERKFLTKTARTQKQAIKFFREPFCLTPVSSLADIADKLTRNEILSSNEFRAIIGYKPADSSRADSLQNKNLNPTEFIEGDEINAEEVYQTV